MLLFVVILRVNRLLHLHRCPPRPGWIDSRVKALANEATYGLPSNHAQTALTLWSYLAILLKKRWAWLVALILILGISFSRLYLGVHFAGDVLGGWIIGVILLVAFLWAEPRVTAWLKPKSIAFQMGAAFALSMVMLGLAALVFRYLRYAIMLLWAMWLAPWTFIRLKLADRR